MGRPYGQGDNTMQISRHSDLKPSPQLGSHARPLPDFRHAHAAVRQPTH